MATFTSRILGSLVFNGAVSEEIEADRGAIWQAAAVVVLSSLASGFGVGGLYDSRLTTFALASALALVAWTAWAMLTLQIGTRMLAERETRADLGQMLRTIGFAAAPGLLQVLAVFPRVRGVIVAVSSVWMFAAMVFAIQRALDYRSVARAVAVCAIGFALSFGLALIVAMLFGSVVS